VIELLLEAERAMSFGRLDRAEEIYQQVVASDPHNSIAVVGLARVALERGDDMASYRLARQALGIDPENDAARRMAVRLEEVLATRGQPVDDPMPQMSGAPPPSSAPPTAPDAQVVTDASATPVPPQRRSIIDRLRQR
jgi:thioredoxin-like negative regulator of GroEL